MNRLEVYLDACRALRALEAAQEDEGKTLARSEAIEDARYVVKSMQMHLSARESWLAARALRAKEDQP